MSLPKCILCAPIGVTDHIVFNEPEMDRIQNYQVLDMDEDGTFYKLYQFTFRKDQDGKRYVSVDMVSLIFLYSETDFSVQRN